ncbi:hypothetical protein FA13DRAFT_1814684 [Coprinellus micaceus]|uniref:Transmembrane protein n=1 Tax=Coprinellus micaceus TaxID=71717 RepID=A0A4Y7T8R4_COPMI|nr:hypothetical protein FA13DRAFT_1814684 [Coprinellus micaceus]
MIKAVGLRTLRCRPLFLKVSRPHLRMPSAPSDRYDDILFRHFLSSTCLEHAIAMPNWWSRIRTFKKHILLLHPSLLHREAQLTTMTSTLAPRPTATCSVAGSIWSYNSRDHSPCTIGAVLGGACSGSLLTIGLLPAQGGYAYGSLTRFQANRCTCNTVYYSLESACAACQHLDNLWLPWSYWSANCSVTYQTYPGALPPGVPVPGWAYLDVVAEDIFNITRARSFIGAEHQPPPPPTPSPPRDRITVTVISTSVSAASPGSTDSPVLSSSERKTSPGAIAGGVIGGVVVLVLAALAIFLIRRRSKRGSAPPEVSAVGTGSTLHPPQSPVSYDGSKHSSDGRSQTYPHPPTHPFGRDNQMQYAQMYGSSPTSASSTPTFPNNPDGQTYYRGVPESMQ